MLLAGLALTLLAPRFVRADALPPDQAACAGAEAGDHCPDGRCESSTCRRANLQGWDRDASSVPPSTEYACLVCVEHDDGGCSLAYGGLASAFGPWLLAGSFALLLSRRKHRR